MILIDYVRDDIAEDFFRNNVKMEKNKIQCFYLEFNGAQASKTETLDLCHAAPSSPF